MLLCTHLDLLRCFLSLSLSFLLSLSLSRLSLSLCLSLSLFRSLSLPESTLSRCRLSLCRCRSLSLSRSLSEFSFSSRTLDLLILSTSTSILTSLPILTVQLLTIKPKRDFWTFNSIWPPLPIIHCNPVLRNERPFGIVFLASGKDGDLAIERLFEAF